MTASFGLCMCSFQIQTLLQFPSLVSGDSELHTKMIMFAKYSQIIHLFQQRNPSTSIHLQTKPIINHHHVQNNLPSLKLTRPLKTGLPKKKVHLPTTNFQGKLAVSFREGKSLIIFQKQLWPLEVEFGDTHPEKKHRGDWKYHGDDVVSEIG